MRGILPVTPVFRVAFLLWGVPMYCVNGAVKAQRMAIVFFLIIALSFSSACTNHPLIDDTTRMETHQIVRKLQCEAKFAIHERVEDLYLRAEHEIVEQNKRQYEGYSKWRANNKTMLESIDKEVQEVEQKVKSTKAEAERIFALATSSANQYRLIEETLEELTLESSKAKALKTRSAQLFERNLLLESRYVSAEMENRRAAEKAEEVRKNTMHFYLSTFQKRSWAT